MIYTYFIQAIHGGPMKIGVSEDPVRRLAQLQTGCPYRLQIIGTIEGDCEAELHDSFSETNCHGEFFAPSRELLELIRTKVDRKRPDVPPVTSLPAERYLTLNEARALLPGRPSLSSIWRWCVEGNRGIQIQHVRVGRRIFITEGALDDWCKALTLCGPYIPTPFNPSLRLRARGESRRKRNHERALARLRAMGI